MLLLLLQQAKVVHSTLITSWFTHSVKKILKFPKETLEVMIALSLEEIVMSSILEEWVQDVTVTTSMD